METPETQQYIYNLNAGRLEVQEKLMFPFEKANISVSRPLGRKNSFLLGETQLFGLFITLTGLTRPTHTRESNLL